MLNVRLQITLKRRSGKNEKMQPYGSIVFFWFYRSSCLLHLARYQLLGRGSGVSQSPGLAGISDIQAARVSKDVNYSSSLSFKGRVRRG